METIDYAGQSLGIGQALRSYQSIWSQNYVLKGIGRIYPRLELVYKGLPGETGDKSSHELRQDTVESVWGSDVKIREEDLDLKGIQSIGSTIMIWLLTRRSSPHYTS